MKSILRTILKSLLIGIGYASALAIGGLVVSTTGLSLPEKKDAIASLAVSFVGGTFAGLFLGPIAASLPATRARHIMVWGCLIFLNLASVAMEGYFFAPELVGDSLPGLIFQQLLAALAVGWMVAALFAPREPTETVALPPRSPLSWIWRFAAGTLIYVFFYFIFGGINYALVTKPYYEIHAGGLAVPAVEVTLMAEVLRGALITLSILPFLLTIRTNKKRLGFLTGLVLFAIGGIVPLTLQVGVLPFFLLLASLWEIFFMNYFTGLILARLLGRTQ